VRLPHRSPTRLADELERGETGIIRREEALDNSDLGLPPDKADHDRSLLRSFPDLDGVPEAAFESRRSLFELRSAAEGCGTRLEAAGAGRYRAPRTAPTTATGCRRYHPSQATMMRRLVPVVVALLTVASVSAARAHTAAAASGITVEQLPPLPVREWWLQADTTDDAGIVRDGANAAALWPLTVGAGVTVAVVDTGLDARQPDLAAHVWQNPSPLPGAIDQNGVSFLPKLLSPPLVENVIINHSARWRRAHRRSLTALRARDHAFTRARAKLLAHPKPNADFADRDGHGTHVAGIVAASRDDSAGYSGIAPGATLMAVQALGITLPESTHTLAVGIRYAADHGARIINMSWGSFSGSSSIRSAVGYAVLKGALVVAASGNWRTDLDTTPVYPASYPGVLSVAATCDGRTLAFFSDFGTNVDLAAPGCAIVSTVPAGQTTIVSQNRPNPLADAMSGTSQAAPMVAGVAALLFSLYPQASAAQVATALCAGVRREAALAGLTRCGGVLDAVAAARALAVALGKSPPAS
jgi:subtilisin family serine protease